MLVLGFLIGLTGALAPGPTLVATINASLKGGWSMGPRVTFGHIVVEIFMVLLVVAGVSVIIGSYSWVIAGIGGGALILFGILTISESRTVTLSFSREGSEEVRPFIAGVVTSIANPYFWIWWFTVGSALLIGAYAGGIILVVVFIVGHWAADLGWLTLVSVSIHRGRFILGEREYRFVMGICGVFLVLFGAYYLSTV